MLAAMRITLLLIVVTLGAACTKHATLPKLPTTPDIEARENAYAAAELRYDGGFWQRQWKRADGGYTLEGIKPAVDEYPSSRAARKTARNRAVIVTLLSALGGGLIGTAAGNQLFASPENRYAHDGLVTLYGSGAALVLVGIVLDQTWAKDAYREIATSYNQELRRDLALPPLR